MNSYQLLRPGGEGSGVWCCGECNTPHFLLSGDGQVVSEANRTAAEACCAPRKCIYCGLLTERDERGKFRWMHDDCFPQVEVRAPHPSMSNPYARLLEEKMSKISEDNWCAGWLIDLEYLLWEMLHEGRDEGWRGVGANELEELRILSEKAEGWIWSGPDGDYHQQLVTFAEWEPIYAAYKSRPPR